jgi:cholesterol transport system auxiliary component
MNRPNACVPRKQLGTASAAFTRRGSLRCCSTAAISAATCCAIFFWAITASFAPGCALLSKGDQGAARYFSLEWAPARLGAVSTEPPGARADPSKLRLGRVTGSAHRDERLVFRDSAHEINYYRELRWNEPPEYSLKRLLARVLFEERGLGQIVGGAGPTLDVQLTAFDEIRFPKHLARAQVVASLHDEHLVIWEETLTVDQAIVEKADGDPVAATVEALGQAMRSAVDRVAERVERELSIRSAGACRPEPITSF